MSWPLVKIGDCCSTGSGGTPSRTNTEYFNGHIPWIKSGDLRENVVTAATEFISDEAVKKSSAKLVPQGAILLAMYGATVGRMALLGIDAATNQAVCNIVPDSTRAFTKYVYYALLHKVPDFLASAVGGAQPNISQGIIKDTLIPLPPLSEQKRIAAILDKADAIRRKRQQAIKLADDFLRSVFLEMFGNPVTKGWDYSTVEQMAAPEKGSMRTGPFGSDLKHSEFVEEGVSVLGIDNAVKNKFSWDKERYISLKKYEELKRYTVKPGDVLITIMGTCGRCAVVPENIPLAINTKHLCCITLDKSKCLPSYLHAYFLMHPIAKRYLEKVAKGAIMDGLNMGMIKDMPIPQVPINVQAQYDAIAKRVSSLILKQDRGVDATSKTFSSLSQKAFSGNL